MGTARFILGRAGTGKTHHIVEQLAALCRADPFGPPVYWLLPKQATFQAERRLTCELGAFSRVRVVDFGQLGQAVLDSCGDLNLPEVTPAGRRMVIAHLLRLHRDQLHYYNAAALRPGLAAELDATFAEFDRAGLDAPGLAAVLDTLDPTVDPAHDALRLKLGDVHLLLSAYAAHIGSDRLDPHRRAQLILDRVVGCPALAAATLFVDDFYDFSAYERKLLAAIAAAVDRTEIALLLDPDDPAVTDPSLPVPELSVFHRTGRAYRALSAALREAGVPAGPTLSLQTVHRPSTLAAVERGLFTRSTPPGADVSLVECPDLRAEVDAVARQIRAATADGRTRFRDVVVIVRSLDDYAPLIDASFGEHGLRYFADHRRSAGHHPLLQVIRAAVLIAAGDWPTEAVMTLAKSGLTGLTAAEADDLENYVIQHRLRGTAAWESAAPWTYRRQLTRRADESELAEASNADQLRRRLATGLAPLLTVARSDHPTVADLAASVFAALTALGVDTALAGWIDAAADDIERREEHVQVWAETVALFEQMVDVIGGARLSVSEFLDVLDGGLEQFDLAIAPPTVDAVLVGQADRTRTPTVRLAFVLGLAEGRFPLARADQLVLSDADRRVLRKRQVELDDDLARQLLDEKLLAYVAFTRPTERLIATRPLADEKGRPLAPSPYWTELRRLCPAAEPDRPDRDTIGTPRQLVDALTRWVRGGAPADDGTLPALYQWFTTAASMADLRAAAWPALSYNNVALPLPADVAAGLFPLPLNATVRQLEDVAACPFRHFARFGLHLTERDAADVTTVDLHNAYHTVVENLTRELLDGGTDWTALDDAAARHLIARHVADVGTALRGEVLLSSARNRYLLNHLERTLGRAVAGLAELTRRGKYRPRFTAVRFGGSGQPELEALLITTPAGRSVQLSGRIDRVDIHERGKAFTVVDYRLTPGTLSLDKVYYGLTLQLLAHLLVVTDGTPAVTASGKALAPAAAMMLGLLRPPGLVAHPDDAMARDDPDFHLRHRPRGLLDDRAVDSLDGGGDTAGWSPAVSAYRNKGGGFGHRGNSDVATADEFAALLDHVRHQLGIAADTVVNGEITVRPYLLGKLSPCPRCAYRPVCRFEPGINTYRVLTPLRREDVLAKVVQ